MSYENKKKQLFECLDAAEKSLNGSCLEQRNEDYHNTGRQSRRGGGGGAEGDDRDRSIERYKRKDSIFKQPALPINKCLRARQRPDHEKNPQRYKHYTLADVTDTSDRMNTSAAFSFLREMENRRDKEEKPGESSSEPPKIVFKNSAKLRQKSNEDEHKSEKGEKIIGNKFVMKEYVVGEKRPKAAKDKKASSLTSAKQLKLSHLDEEEEDD